MAGTLKAAIQIQNSTVNARRRTQREAIMTDLLAGIDKKNG
jgi:hypothetical protein